MRLYFLNGPLRASMATDTSLHGSWPVRSRVVSEITNPPIVSAAVIESLGRKSCFKRGVAAVASLTCWIK